MIKKMSAKKARAAECPMCFEVFSASVIEVHASNCSGRKRSLSQSLGSPLPQKKQRTVDESDTERCAATGLEPERSKVDPAKNELGKRPLADAMRPSTFDEVLGQDELFRSNSLWRSLVSGEPASLPSLIFWGPPGSGKTSLAHVIANRCKASSALTRFVKLSACTSGVADVKEAVNAAKNEWKLFKRKTILFIDEVHRFNKIQQDVFLPHIEDGTVTLIGATTENPSFSLNNALISRCRVLTLSKLGAETVESIIRKAVGRYGSGITIEDDAVAFLANSSDGDARTALNSLECVLRFAESTGKTNVKSSDVAEAICKGIRYDRKGDEHYHCASALQKSVRGSSPDAALYWTMRMFEGGEDPMFIARRFVRIASEDIGMADPSALAFAVSTMQGCQLIGRPECNVLLAQCAVHLAKAPKCHKVMYAMGKAVELIKRGGEYLPPVPLRLRNANSKLEREAGYGRGYSYDLSEVQKMSYMPDGMENVKFIN